MTRRSSRRHSSRLRRLLARPDVRVQRDPAHQLVLLESFIPGHEFALEGLMTDGRLHTLAIFDKPDPLDGPFFEETIYLTLADLDSDLAQRIRSNVAAAAAAIGLRHGPIHAECRVGDCGRIRARSGGAADWRHLRPRAAVHVGDPGAAHLARGAAACVMRSARTPRGWRREAAASGVMMIPIPGEAFTAVSRAWTRPGRVPGIDDVVITAKPDQLLVPLPEGASYLGFIFARAGDASRGRRGAASGARAPRVHHRS